MRMQILTAVVLCAGLGFAWSAALHAGEASAKPDRVVFETSMGDIVIELFSDKAPVTVQNFLAYVDADFYEGTVFHRVIPGFVIQGGGMTPDI